MKKFLGFAVVIAILFSVICAENVTAQAGGDLSGGVRAMGGGGLRDAKVEARDRVSQALVGTAFADSAGHFFMNLPFGFYKAEASKIGYNPVTIDSIKIDAGVPHAFRDFFLSPSGGGGFAPMVMHFPPPNVPAAQNMLIRAVVSDIDGDLNFVEVGLKHDLIQQPVIYRMQRSNADTFVVNIPGSEINGNNLYYFVRAVDLAMHETKAPLLSDPMWGGIGFYVTQVQSGGGGGQLHAPQITHMPPPPVQSGLPLEIHANVMDQDGNLARVELSYLPSPTSPPIMVPMNKVFGPGGDYFGSIPGMYVQSPGVSYIIEAEDSTYLRTHAPAPTDSIYGAKGVFFVPVNGGSGNSPFIAHVPPPSIKAGEAFTVTATVTDPDMNLREVALLYGPPAPTWMPVWVPMTNTGGNNYSATIPGSSIFAPGILYHIEARDLTGNMTKLPDPFMGPSEFFVQVMSGTGNPPTITHTRLVGPMPANQSVIVRATAVDPDSGGFVRNVGIDVERQGFPPIHYPMTIDMAQGPPNYMVTLAPVDVQFPGFAYRIAAEDNMGNLAAYPSFTEPNVWVDVSNGSGGGNAPAIIHTPVAGPKQAYNPVQIAAVVTDQDGNLTGVQIEMDRPDMPPMVFPMWRSGAQDTFVGMIPGPEVKMPGFGYRISAQDMTGNKTSQPSFQYPSYWVNVTSGAATGNPPVIAHTAITGPIPSNTPVRFRAYITDPDAGDVIMKAEVEVGTAGAPPRFFMMWRQAGFPDSFIVDLPGPEVQSPGFSYRINAQDMSGNIASQPGAQSVPYWVNVGGSAGGTGTAPAITHQMISGVKPQGMPIRITAYIKDTDPGDFVREAGVEFERPGFAQRFLPMWSLPGSPDTFVVDIMGFEITPPGFEYRIIARDSQGNNSGNPSYQNDPYWVDIGGTQGQGRPPVISHVPPAGFRSPGMPIQLSAIATDPDSGDRVVTVGVNLEQPGMAPKFFQLMMSPVRPDSFYGSIPGPEVMSPGFSYRLDAVDSYGNHGALPQFQYSPYWVDVSATGGGVGSPPTIVHTLPSGVQAPGISIVLTAKITDPDAGDRVDGAGIELESPNGPPMFFQMYPSPSNPDSFTGMIPGSEARIPGFGYRISAKDTNGNRGSMPSFQYPPYWVNVGGGSGVGNPPAIVHNPPSGMQAAYAELVLRAKITDPDPGDFVREAFVEFQSPNGPSNYFPMMPDTGSTFYARIPGPSMMPPGFGYRITAKDGSGNQTSSPKSQDKPQWVDIGTGKGTGQPPTVTHTPPAGMMQQGVPIALTVIARDPDAGDRVVEVAVQVERPGMPPTFYQLASTAAKPDSFVGTIPGTEVQLPGLSYRVNAKDTFGNLTTVPGFQYPSYWVMVGGGAGGGQAGNPPTIVHMPPSGPQTSGKDLPITAKITDPDLGDMVSGAGIELEKPNAPPMFFPLNAAPGKPDSFVGMVPGTEVRFPGFNYRVSAKDTRGNSNVLPSYQYPPYWIDVPYGAGTGNPPVILHTPVAGNQPAGTDIRLRAKVTDSDPGDFIAEVSLEVYPSVGPPMHFPAMPDTGSTYVVTMFGPSVQTPGFGYRFMARDSKGNVTSNPRPQDKPYWVNVATGGGTGSPPRIVHSVIPSPQEAGKNIDVRAQVTSPDSGIAIQEVVVEFTANGMPPSIFPMTYTSYMDSTGTTRSYYYTRIPGANVLWPGFGYRIGAKDSRTNKSLLPEPQYPPYWVEVKSQGGALNPPTIVHSKIASPQQEMSNVRVTANVTDLDRMGVRIPVTQVFIDVKTAFGSGKLFMRPVGDPSLGNFEIEIPGPMVTPPGFGYRVVAQDADANQSANPGWQYDPYWIEVGRFGSSGNPPAISHIKVASPQPRGVDIPVECTVTARDSGKVIDKVMVDVQTPNAPPFQFPLVKTLAVNDSSGGGDVFKGMIPGFAVNFPGFNYRLRAFDNKGAMGEDPLSQYPPYWIEVVSVSGGTKPPVITHQPIASAQPGREVLIRAEVTDPDTTRPGSDIKFVELVAYSRLNPREDHFPMMPWIDPASHKQYYQGIVPPNLVMSPGFGYKIVAVDGGDARAELPQAQYPPFSVDVTGVGTPPVIVHSVVPQATPNQPVNIKATITDDTGVRDAVVQFYPPTGAPSEFQMRRTVGNDYETSLPGYMILPPGFGYKIRATDLNGSIASSPDPTKAPYYVLVGGGQAGGRPPEITVEPVRSDTVTVGRPVLVRARINDPDGPATGPTGIYAEIMAQRLQANAQPLNFPMMEVPGDRGLFAGMIPGDMVAPPGFIYGVRAKDSQGMVSMNPAPPNPPFTVGIQGSRSGQPPVISHSPIVEILVGTDMIVSASVTDPDNAVGRVFMQYMKQGAQNPMPAEINMTLVSGNNYTARIPGSEIVPPGILYNIVAMDVTGNRSEMPGYPMNWYMANVKGQGTGKPPQIFHTPLTSVFMGTDARIRTKVIDDKDSLMVFLGYMSPASGPEPKRKQMVKKFDPATGEKMYEGILEASLVVPPGFMYMIEAVDIDGNHAQVPMYPNPPFFVEVKGASAANNPPDIVHTPIMSSAARSPIQVTATITDDDSVRAAKVIYVAVAPGAQPLIVNLVKSGSTYTGTIPARDVLPPGLKYSIQAEDYRGGRSINPSYPKDPYFVEVRTTLTLTAPADFTVTNSDSVTVSGADTGSWAAINGIAVTNWSGTNFSQKVALAQGVNIVRVMGSDSTVVERKVVKDTTPPQTAPVLVQPARGTELSSSTVSFGWLGANDASSYILNYSRYPSFPDTATQVVRTADLFYTAPTLRDGRWFWRMKAVDAAGNIGIIYSQVWEFVVNTIILAPPQIDKDNLLADANNLEITVNGTAKPGSRVTLFIHGASLVGTGNMVVDLTVNASRRTDPDGIFAVSGVRLFQGENIITAIAKDSTGVSALSDPITIIHDTEPPLPPVVSEIKGKTIYGVAEPGVTVGTAVGRADAPIDSLTVDGTTTADATNGNFSYELTVSDGTYHIGLQAVDKAGNTSDTKSMVDLGNVLIDTVKPDAPVITSPANNDTLTFNVASVSGTEASSDARVVAIYTGEDVGGKGAVSTGTFSARVALAPGINTIYAVAVDAAGNTSDPSDTITVYVGSNSIAITDLSPADDPATLFANESFVNTNTPTITGTVGGATDVFVSIDAGQMITATPSISYTTAHLTDGAHSHTVWARNATDSISVTTPFVIDTSFPAIDTLVVAGGDTLINNGVPQIFGRISDTGVGVTKRGIQIVSNGTEVRDRDNLVYNPENGKIWYVPSGPIADGTYNVDVSITDGAGNKTEKSLPPFRVDTTPPYLLIAVSPPFPVKIFGITKHFMLTVVFANEPLRAAPTLNYTGSTGDSGTIVVTGPNRDNATGLYYYTNLDEKPNGAISRSLSARAIDLAGNLGIATEAFVLSPLNGAQGGTVTNNEGIGVTIPGGATDTTLTVSITSQQSDTTSTGAGMSASPFSKIGAGASRILASELGFWGVANVTTSDIPTRVGKIYSFGPDGTQFSTPVEITLSYAAQSGNTQTSKLGMYTYLGTGLGWQFVQATVDADNKSVTGETLHFSRYSLATDAEDPVFTVQSPADSSRITSNLEIHAVLSDNLSGVKPGTAAMTINGTPVSLIGAVITDTSFSYQGSVSDLTMDYAIVLTVEDNQGNTGTKELHLRAATDVLVSKFEARSKDEGEVEVFWQAAGDPEGAFNLYRADGADPKVNAYGSVNKEGLITGMGDHTFTDKSVEAEKTYTYRLGYIDASGFELFYGQATVTVRSNLPKVYDLKQNFPNPASGLTEIRYQLPRAGKVSLRVFNANGQLVATLVDGKLPPGYYTRSWNGKTFDGKEVASGVYFYRLDAGSYSRTRKLVLIK